MRKLLQLQVLWLLLQAGVLHGQESLKNANRDQGSRLQTVENMLASLTVAQEQIQAALQQETAKRVALESQLTTTIKDQEMRIKQLSSLLQVANDRVAALDGTLQGEIKLREEAEIKAGDVILQLSRKMGHLESDISLLSILSSRMRDLEGQKGIHIEEIMNLQKSVSQLRRIINQEQRTIQQLAASVQPLNIRTSENSRTLTDLGHRVDQMNDFLISYNESIVAENAVLMLVKNDVLDVTEALSTIETSVANLTESVSHLHHLTPKRLLDLCPKGYRKVGEDCLQLIEDNLSWEMSRVQCEELGISAGGIGDLAVPKDLHSFRNFVHKMKTNSDYLWLGASRDSNGEWSWVGDQSPNHEGFQWDIGEPDNTHDQHQLCVKTDGSIKFHDCIEGSNLGAVCQLR